MLKKIKAYVAITRPNNGIMAIIGVFLGSWLSNSSLSIVDISILAFVALTALSFGNVINDIKDLEGDKINHPERPLPAGNISLVSSYALMFFLGALSLSCAFSVSKLHFFVTLIPIIILTLYTLYFKGIPLLGNFLVSLLVAYTLIFGALGSKDLNAVIYPVLLAFLLNMEREIIKDFQDKEGDLKTGIKTTATLSSSSITLIFAILSFLYLILLPLPYFTQYYSKIYLITALIFVLPLHLLVSASLLKLYRKLSPKKISKFIKIEMILGLAALALDKIISIKF